LNEVTSGHNGGLIQDVNGTISGTTHALSTQDMASYSISFSTAELLPESRMENNS